MSACSVVCSKTINWTVDVCSKKKKKGKNASEAFGLPCEVQLEFFAHSHTAFKLDRKKIFLFILQFSRGDLDANS